METTFQLTTKDNLQLKGIVKKVENPVAILLFIHGMGEHIRRYEHVMDYYNAHNITCMGMDLRGHGESAGHRGHTPSYEHLMNDLQLLLDEGKKIGGNLPVFIYAHSMGGNLALNFLIRKKPKIEGAIVTGPYLRLAFNPPKWKIFLGHLTAKLVPCLTQSTGLDVTAISRDVNVVEKYKTDPLVHDKITSAFFVNVHFAGPYAIEHAHEIQVPVLIMHGLADKLTWSQGSSEFAANAKSFVNLKLWPDLFHEIHNEPEKQEVFDYQWSWLKKFDCIK